MNTMIGKDWRSGVDHVGFKIGQININPPSVGFFEIDVYNRMPVSGTAAPVTSGTGIVIPVKSGTPVVTSPLKK